MVSIDTHHHRGDLRLDILRMLVLLRGRTGSIVPHSVLGSSGYADGFLVHADLDLCFRY